MKKNQEKSQEIDIMSSLQQKKMQIIHKEFEKNPEGLVTHSNRISINLWM